MEKQIFTFGLQMPTPLLVFILVAIPVAVILLYRWVVIKVSTKDKIIFAIIRILMLYLLFACIMQPVIRGKKLNEAYFAVLIDASKSMTLDDAEGGKQRIEVAKKLISSGDLIKELQKTFKGNTIKYYSFAMDSKPLSKDILELKADGEKTDLVKAVNSTVDALQTVPLSGMLCITDGVDNVNSPNVVSQLGYSMREKAIPLYFVGVGSEVKLKDVQVTEVTGPDAIEEKQPLTLNITFSSQGYPAKTVPVSIYEDEKLIKKFDQHLPADGTIGAKFSHNPTGIGFRRYKADIPIDKDEFVKDNNSSFFTVNIIKKKEKLRILFVQGFISEEFRFISRTLKVDPDLELVSISRSGPGTYLISGVKDDKEYAALSAGFPKDKEALYRYDAIVFTNLTPDFFNKEQLDTLSDFVKSHGGGFLALGSSDNFKPAWNNTPVADMLPVILEKDASLFRSFPTLPEGPSNPYEFKMELTPEGMMHEIFINEGDFKKDKEKWESMPTLYGYAPVVKAKAGSTVLSVHNKDKNQNGRRIILAVQNYGAGKTAALTVDSLWRWRLKSPSTDKSYEKFWRQLIHWLTTERLEKISLKIDRNFYAVKENVKIEVAVFEREFQSKATNVTANIIDPQGKLNKVKLDFSIGGNWEYEGKFVPQMRGGYRIKVIAKNSFGQELLSNEIYFDVRETGLEFSNVTLNETGLMSLASISNGKYYKPNEVTSKISKDLTKANVFYIQVDKDLWDSPWVLGAFIFLFALEWILRKMKGLI
ncbi:MAG: hypothetical protein ABH873_05030 [Candidatus Firestonebacteria bacterium]